MEIPFKRLTKSCTMFSFKLHVLYKHVCSRGPSLQQLKFGARVKKCFSQYNI